jgi:ribosomal protein L29
MKTYKDQLRTLSEEQLRQRIETQRQKIRLLQRDLATMKDVLLEEYDGKETI